MSRVTEPAVLDLVEKLGLDWPRLSRTAAEAMLRLRDPANGAFYRSTEHFQRLDRSGNHELTPTVTAKCLDALMMAAERDDICIDAAATARVDDYLRQFLEWDLVSVVSTLDEGQRRSLFTQAMLVEVLASIAKRLGQTEAGAFAARSLREAATQLVQLLQDDQQDCHPFLLFHAVRGLSLARAQLSTDEGIAGALGTVVDAIICQTDLLLARTTRRVAAPADAVALAFCGATLAVSDTYQHADRIVASLRAAGGAQDASGCWPLGRVVRQDKDLEKYPDVEITTYEISWVIAESALRLMECSVPFSEEPVIDAVVRASEYIARSSVAVSLEGDQLTGWCSDHPYGHEMVESWVSATVLQALLGIRDVADRVVTNRMLRHYPAQLPNAPEWPQWLHWGTFRETNEWDSAIGVLGYLDRVFVQPALSRNGGFPTEADRSVSCLLFGPPGTGKTSVARAIGQGLGWPVVSLSPGSFIDRGLEFIEARAGEVFGDLLAMSRVVVLFDECDELFRERRPDLAGDQLRSITAFVTSSMLPKLQDLHDRGRVIFFVCTNHIRSIDPAVRRGGRIDHIVAIGPPDQQARRRLVDSLLGEAPETLEARDQLALQTERFVRGEVLRAAHELLLSEAWPGKGDAVAEATRVAGKLRPSLVISEKQYQDYLKDRDELSHPHLAAVAGNRQNGPGS